VNRRRLALLAAAVVLLLLFGGRWVAIRFTEHAWYDSLGEAARFRALLARSLAWQFLAAVTFTAWYAAHTFAVYRSIGSVHLPRRLGNLEIAEQVPPRILLVTAMVIALVLGLSSAWVVSDLSGHVALYRASIPLGLVEDVLGRDASFYLARLPLLELLHGTAAVSVIIATVVVLALYLLTGNMTISGRRVRLTPHARNHLVVILVALAMVLAWGFHLDGLQLVGGGGRDGGALAPADRSVRLPASNALALVSLVVAVISSLSLRWMRPLVLFAAWVTLGASALLARAVVPLLADAWRTTDSQSLTRTLARYQERWTREGLALTQIRSRELAAGAVLRPESTAALERALAGLSPFSGEAALLESALETAEAADSALRRTWSITLTPVRDETGRPRLLALAIPQVDAFAVTRRVPRPRWSATHRGAGAWAGDPVAVDVGLRSGPLRYFRRLDPAESSLSRVTLVPTNGPVRFVPRPAELAVLAPSELSEDVPPPGILLRSFPRRLLLAWALQSPPLLGEQTGVEDRVLYWRDLPARLKRLYPFAVFDAPRGIMDGGRLLWLADGYLVSGRFPLARAVNWHGEPVNFITAAYLVTVDAASGETRLYVRGRYAAFAAAVARAERAGTRTLDALPVSLRNGLVYPVGLFLAQAAMLARLGDDGAGWMPDLRDTASGGRQDAARMRFTALHADLDGSGPRLWWTSAYSDLSGRGLGAVVAASASGADLHFNLLRADSSILPTPSAAAARLAGAPDALAAIPAPVATVRRGQVMVVPAAGTVAYVQAVFAAVERGRSPHSVEALAVLAGGRVGVGRDVAGTVRALGSPGGRGATLQADAALAEARGAFLAMDSARAAGDWERFGRAWQALRRALRADGGRP
jgi:uncharacterized membrane protein (UPF0182 family)